MYINNECVNCGSNELKTMATTELECNSCGFVTGIPKEGTIVDMLVRHNYGVFKRMSDGKKVIYHPNGYLEWATGTNINFKNDKFETVAVSSESPFNAIKKLEEGKVIYVIENGGKIRSYSDYNTAQFPARSILKDRWLVEI